MFSGTVVALAPEKRERIVSLYVGGKTPHKIARRLHLDRSEVEEVCTSPEVQAARQAARAACNEQAWTDAENDRLEALWAVGMSDAQIATELNRTLGAVQYQRTRILELRRHPDGTPILATASELELRYDPFARFASLPHIAAGFAIERPDEVEVSRARTAAILAALPAPAPIERRRARGVGLACGSLPEVSITDPIYPRLAAAGPVDCIDCGEDAIVTAGRFAGARTLRHLKCTGCGRSWRQELLG